MPARHTFSAARMQRQVAAAASQGALEALVETQGMIQRMLSQPGSGRIYAKTAGGARRLDQFIGEDYGLKKQDRERVATARHLHTAFRGRGKFKAADVVGAEAVARQRRSRTMFAMRRGVDLTDAQIASLLNRRGKRGNFANLGEAGLHRASSPGQPPAVRTGRLRRSVQMARPRRINKGTLLGWGIGIRLKYAKWLEEGTTRMAKRPYVDPSLEAMKPIAPKIIANRLRLAGFMTA